MIKKFNSNNVEILLRIYDSANSIYPENFIGKGELSYFYEFSKSNEIYVNYVNDEPVGFISITNKFDMVEISGLYVLKEHHNKGIGRELVQFIEELVDEDYIYLKTLRFTRPAICFYRNNGYGELNENEFSLLTEMGVKEERWEHLLIKKL
jgi:GNAT superfamily N-acetyltransferase